MREAMVLMDKYGNILCELEERGGYGFYALPAEFRDAFCGMFAEGDEWRVVRVALG